MNEHQSIKIEVDDPVILQLLPDYVQRRRLEIFQLQRLTESEDFEKIRIIGHNLKGSGSLYGLSQIGVFGASLEEKALEENATAILELIKEIEKYLTKINL